MIYDEKGVATSPSLHNMETILNAQEYVADEIASIVKSQLEGRMLTSQLKCTYYQHTQAI